MAVRPSGHGVARRIQAHPDVRTDSDHTHDIPSRLRAHSPAQSESRALECSRNVPAIRPLGPRPQAQHRADQGEQQRTCRARDQGPLCAPPVTDSWYLVDNHARSWSDGHSPGMSRQHPRAAQGREQQQAVQGQGPKSTPRPTRTCKHGRQSCPRLAS